MTIPTIQLTVVVSEQTGAPVTGAVVKATLNAPDLVNGVYVDPSTTQAVADGTGTAVLTLFPNALGSGGPSGATWYKIEAFTADGSRRIFSTTAFLPNTNVNLSAVYGTSPAPAPADLPMTPNVMPIVFGGTGANNAAAAVANLGFLPSGNFTFNSLALLTPLPVASGGTESNNPSGARSALGAQTQDGDLDALSGLGGTGFAVRIAANTWAQRSILGTAGLNITNLDGVAGDVIINLANDVGAIEALSGTGFAVRTGTSVWAQRALTQPAAGITISNNDGVSGNPTFALANDLSAVEGLAGTGLAVRSATDTWVQRAISAGAGVSVSNGDGVSGNPTITAQATINSQSTNYTTVLADAENDILHPSTDNNPRTFTIAANASVAYPVGATLNFINKINTLTIAINSDTLTLAGAGTTGSRSLAANGIATAKKITSTEWLISGVGLS